MGLPSTLYLTICEEKSKLKFASKVAMMINGLPRKHKIVVGTTIHFLISVVFLFEGFSSTAMAEEYQLGDIVYMACDYRKLSLTTVPQEMIIKNENTLSSVICKPNDWMVKLSADLWVAECATSEEPIMRVIITNLISYDAGKYTCTAKATSKSIHLMDIKIGGIWSWSSELFHSEEGFPEPENPLPDPLLLIESLVFPFCIVLLGMGFCFLFTLLIPSRLIRCLLGKYATASDHSGGDSSRETSSLEIDEFKPTLLVVVDDEEMQNVIQSPTASTSFLGEEVQKRNPFLH
ncbi:hypothetical protein RRG08_064774 [Elysia crispata]|uniref:Uncharacterized protein n=1 Tax=Elysia crispata TaxID=231223 RepID=A0AAE0YZL9_9GAST|nr:hypothetical protein RRG08_064774 [Elysia crispata]